jgi:hypothetical protein
MSYTNQLIYTIESLEMSGDNAHLPHFRSDLRKVVAALRAGQAMRDVIEKEWDSIGFLQTEEAMEAWDAATRDDSLEEYSRLSQEIGEDV